MDIKKLSQIYVDVLNKAGSLPLKDFQEENFPLVWADACEKIMNGMSLYKKGESFLAQLKEAREFAGSFKVILNDLIVANMNIAEQNLMSAITYELQSEKAGSFHTSAFLTFNAEGQITEINEVCCKL